MCQSVTRIRLIDPEYECKASILGETIRRTCDLIPELELKELCYLSVNSDKVVFLNANTLERMGKDDIEIYGDLYCIKKAQEAYVILPNIRSSRGKYSYIMLLKLYGSLIEWKVLLLASSDNEYVIIRKEGTKRSIKMDLEQVIEKLPEYIKISKTHPIEKPVSIPYK